MGISEEYLTLIDQINARTEESNHKINMALATYIGEAETAVQVATEDSEQLSASGYDLTKISLISNLTVALREVQSLWELQRFETIADKKTWNNKVTSASDFQEFCLHAMEFAFRDDEYLLGRVEAIREGGGDANLVQDLNDISVLALEHSQLFAHIKFDMVHFTTAASLSEELSKQLAQKQSLTGSSELRERRDKAYSWLSELIDELYACGQYVFWKDLERKKLYSSAFLRRKNHKNYLARKKNQLS